MLETVQQGQRNLPLLKGGFKGGEDGREKHGYV